jgi:hypothetical protein
MTLSTFTFFGCVAAAFFDSWPEMLELLSRPASIAIFSAGVVGLFFGWLMRGGDSGRSRKEAPVPEEGLAELRWRHEKLVLTERQLMEKQSRLAEFSEAYDDYASEQERLVGLRFFSLAERMRETRQRSGTDYSRLTTLRGRLEEIASKNAPGTDSVHAALDITKSRLAVLETVREPLRDISDRILDIEESFRSGKFRLAEKGRELRKELMEIKGRVVALPQGWSSSGDEANRRLREILAGVSGAEVDALREILLVDGSITASLAGEDGGELVGAITDAMADLESSRKTAPVSSVTLATGPGANVIGPLGTHFFTGNPFTADVSEATPELRLKPDTAFRAPSDFETPPERNGGGFHDLTSQSAPTSGASCEEEVDEENRSLVIFCSNDVELWGKNVYRGAYCRARAIKDFPDWAEWISVRRLDTKERVFAPVRTASLFNGQTSDPVGFNGTNELFYGARHLGIFSESCPNDVETRFTYGGWGFGHRAGEMTADAEQLQAAGWEGREIPADTVFEIAIHAELPKLESQDRILGGNP